MKLPKISHTYSFISKSQDPTKTAAKSTQTILVKATYKHVE